MNNHCKSVGRWISTIYRYGHIYMTKEFKQFGGGGAQYFYLLLLYKKDGLRQQEISNILNIDKGTTARAIKKLEQEGYVIRKQDKEDKRAYGVYLTEKANNIKPDIFKILTSWTEILTKGFDEKEQELALTLLERMCNNACDHIKKNNEDN